MSQHKRVFITTVADEDCDNVDVVLRSHSILSDNVQSSSIHTLRSGGLRLSDGLQHSLQLLALKTPETSVSRILQQSQRYRIDSDDSEREQPVLSIEETDGIMEDHHDNTDLNHSNQQIIGPGPLEDPSGDIGMDHDDDVQYDDEDTRSGALDQLSYTPSQPMRSSYGRINVDNSNSNHQQNLRSLLSAAEQLKYQQLISRSTSGANSIHVSHSSLIPSRTSAQLLVENGRMNHISSRDDLGQSHYIRRTSPGDLGSLNFNSTDPVNENTSADEDTSTQGSTLGGFEQGSSLNMSHLSPNDRSLPLHVSIRTNDTSGGIILSALCGSTTNTELDSMHHIDKSMITAPQHYTYSTPEYKGRPRKHPYVPGKYPCEYCGWRCAKPSVLKKHIRSHTNERPYPCRYCNISFKTKSNLSKHEKSKSHISMMNELKIQANTASQATEDVAMLCRRLEETEAHRDTFTRQDALLEALTRGSRSSLDRSTEQRSIHLDNHQYLQSNSIRGSGSSQHSTRQISETSTIASEFPIRTTTSSQLSAMRLPRGQPMTGVLQYQDDSGILRQIRVRVQMHVNDDGEASLEWVSSNGSVIRGPQSRQTPLNHFRSNHAEYRSASVHYPENSSLAEQLSFELNSHGEKLKHSDQRCEDEEEQVIVQEEDVVCTEEVEVVDHGGGRGRSSIITSSSHMPLIVHDEEGDVGSRLGPMVFEDDENGDVDKDFHFSNSNILEDGRQRLDDDEDLKDDDDDMMEEVSPHVEPLSVPMLMGSSASNLVEQSNAISRRQHVPIMNAGLESISSECTLDEEIHSITGGMVSCDERQSVDKRSSFENSLSYSTKNTRSRTASQRTEQNLYNGSICHVQSRTRLSSSDSNSLTSLTHISAPNVNAYHMPQEVAVNLSSSRNPTRYLLEDSNDSHSTERLVSDSKYHENDDVSTQMRTTRGSARLGKRNSNGISLDILSGIGQAINLHKARSRIKVESDEDEEDEAYAMNEFIVVDEDENNQDNQINDYYLSNQRLHESLHLPSHDDKTYCKICNRWIEIGRMKAHLMTHKLAGDDSREVNSSNGVSLVTRKQSMMNNSRSSIKNNNTVPITSGPSGPRQFRCNVCNVGFRQVGHLNKHNRSKLHLTNVNNIKSENPSSSGTVEKINSQSSQNPMTRSKQNGKTKMNTRLQQAPPPKLAEPLSKRMRKSTHSRQK